MVGVEFGGEAARDVAYDFEDEADGEGGEVPGTVVGQLDGVND